VGRVFVTPAEAGVQDWIPAFAGMTRWKKDDGVVETPAQVSSSPDPAPVNT